MTNLEQRKNFEKQIQETLGGYFVEDNFGSIHKYINCVNKFLNDRPGLRAIFEKHSDGCFPYIAEGNYPEMFGMDYAHASKKPAFNATVFSIEIQLHRYAKLSDKQVNLLFSIAERDTENRARWDAEAAELAPVPEGRIEIEGKILSVKEKDSQYGLTLKCLIMDDRNFKVWGTVPGKLKNAQAGDRIKIRATVKRSKDDGFGFYSRPTLLA